MIADRLFRNAADSPAPVSDTDQEAPDTEPNLSTQEAVNLAEEHAPYYYKSHREWSVSPDGVVDPEATQVWKSFVDDWEYYLKEGELPERIRWEAWAAHEGHGEEMNRAKWSSPNGSVDEEARDAALVRLWDEGAEERGFRELEDHQVAMAAAGIGSLSTQVAPPGQPTWVPLMDRAAFEEAEPSRAVEGWRDAHAQAATGDVAAKAAAAQLAEHVRQRFGVDPSDYLLAAMTERSANHAEGRRAAEDRARSAEEASTVTLSDPSIVEHPALDQAQISRQRVVELNQAAHEHFEAQLRPGSAGHQYLVDRLGEDVMQGPWAVGYAPPGWTRLTDHLRDQGASDTELVAAGLGRVSSRGNVIDAFRDRALVGIRDSTDGALVGFVGRDLSGDERAPKYVNTGATPAFTKGDHVFGLAEAGRDVRLVRTEGPFDAIAISLAGEGQAAGVAPLGTSMTDTQATLLAERAASGRLWLANDTDLAGQIATREDMGKLAARGIEVRAVEISGGDPAEAWKQDPLALRSTVAHLDEASPAGEVVVDRFLVDHHDRLAAGDRTVLRDLDAVVDLATGSMPSQIDRELLLARVDLARRDLNGQGDDAQQSAASLRLEASSYEEEARGFDPRNRGAEDNSDAELDSDRSASDASDRAAAVALEESRVAEAAGDDIDDQAAALTAPSMGDYERSQEADLDSLGESARGARVSSGHGFAQPTGEMVRGSARARKTKAGAGRTEPRGDQRRLGRGLGR